MSSVNLKINHNCLSWSRKNLELSIEEVCHMTRFSKEDLAAWEEGDTYPRLTQLRKLARIYRRALSFYFLPEITLKHSCPREFRTLSSAKGIHFSYKTYLAFKRADELRLIAKELSRNIDYVREHNFEYTKATGDPELLAENYRKKVGLDFETQKKWHDGYEAFNDLKIMFEKLGVCVAQKSFSVKESRGFALIDSEFPIIMVNTKDVINGRIFTLAHEFAHILLNTNGIFLYRETDELHSSYKTVEKFCNHFAGAFLVPKTALLNHPIVKDISKSKKIEDHLLRTLSTHFKVSRQVILRRLVLLGLTDLKFYDEKIKEWEEMLKKHPPKKRSGGQSNPPKDCVSNNGTTLVSLALENYKVGKISAGDVSEYLDIKAKHIQSIHPFLDQNITKKLKT